MSKDKADECVKVVLRCRPMNSTEKQAGRERIVEMNTSSGQIRLQNPAVSEPPKEYTFDGVYNWDSRQVDVYDGTCKPIVTQVLTGFNGTVFAYGQTGTGKTFSMEGVAGDEDLKGIIPRCFEHIFDEIGAIDEKEFREPPDPPAQPLHHACPPRVPLSEQWCARRTWSCTTRRYGTCSRRTSRTGWS